MTKPDWDRIQEIYHQARQLPHVERRAFVGKASGGDTAFEREVLELLAVDDEPFPEPPGVDIPLAPAADEVVGTTLDARYFVEKALSRGGMSRIYFARDLKVNRKAVVIKILSQELLEHPYARQKFDQEVEALSRIRHSGVVEVSDKGQLDDGRPYFVMQFVDGENLRSQITNEGMDLERAASILKQIGAALDHVHEKSVFHRDLKPENIMLKGGTDEVVLIDFGIAKVRDSVVAQSTAAGASAGTMSYMSPEQLCGELITPASDIYSMAVVAYEIVTGRRPFNPSSAAQLLHLQRAGVDVKPIALRRNLPHAAEEVILSALSFKPASRPQNAKQFGNDLARVLVDPYVPRVGKRRQKLLLMLLGVAVISFGIYIFWKGWDDDPLAPNRSFSYFLTVQRMHDGKPYQEPFRSHGDETYGTGDKFRLTVTTPVPAYVYIFNEGAPELNETSFKMIYPNRATNKGSASLGANQSVQSDWITFRGPAGAENFWIVWSTSPVSELDAAINEAFKDPAGGLTGQTLITLKQYLTVKNSEIDATTYNYNANRTAIVRARRDLLVTLAQFKHE